MGAALMMILQAVAASPPPPVRIDLMRPVDPLRCTGPVGDEIVVCGTPADRYRLSPLREDDREVAPRAQIGLFGGSAIGSIEAEGATMPNGLRSHRLMVRLRVPS